ncbi:MAG: serine/threonine protein kinase [Proteobacteria bacterium]|nr:serine/threonine protein kinase [Pseudomonadota bacterium]
MLEAGTELGEGRYRITGELAKGGMATVYRALDADRKEACAIKLLRPREGSLDQMKRRFHREAAMMTRLRHPNIVRVYDTGSVDLGPYLVMELAEGGSAWDWVLRHGPMPPRLAVRVLVEVLAGLEHAHQHSVVHRDVKPQNILFDWMGHPKLSDFGVARITDGTAAQTTTSGTILGTYHYLAPEIREDARLASSISDVYASGGCLYALLMGRHPRELHGADAFPDVLDGIPAPLKPVIKKATRFEQAERYASARDLADALEEVVESLPEIEESTISAFGTGTHSDPPASKVHRASRSSEPPEPAEDGAGLAFAVVTLLLSAAAVAVAAAL